MRRLVLSAAIAASCIPSAFAVKGMWQPAQLPKIANDLKEHGLKLDPKALTDLTAYPWESVSGDWLFNPKLNRSIQVDVRYMLWVMDHLDHADNLLKEMGVKR